MEDFTTETTEGTENGRWYQGNSSQEISSNQKNILPFFTDPHPLFSLLSPLSLRSVSSVVSVVNLLRFPKVSLLRWQQACSTV